MVETPTTANRGYPKTDLSNTPVEDMPRVNGALDGIDADVANILVELATKAQTGHGHTIEEITNLASMLASLAPLNHNHALAGLSDVNIDGAPAGRPLVTTVGGEIGFGPAIATAAAQLAIAAITGMSAGNVQAALEELNAGKANKAGIDGDWSVSGELSVDECSYSGSTLLIHANNAITNMLEFLDTSASRGALFGLLNDNKFLIRLYDSEGAFRDGLTMYETGLLKYDGSTFVNSSTEMALPLADGVTGATQAAGDNSKKVATTAYVDAAALTMTESEPIPVTAAGAYPWTHGLGAAPKLWQAFARCVTASNGYSVGDEVLLTFSSYYSGSWRVSALWADATEVGISFSESSVAAIGGKAASGYQYLTSGSFELFFRVWS